MDSFLEFFRLYIQGDFLKALAMVIRSRDSCYDDLEVQRFIAQTTNFADGSIFGDVYDHKAASTLILQIVEYAASNKKLPISAVDTIKQENTLRKYTPELLKLTPLDRIPFPFETLVERHQNILIKIDTLLEEKPGLQTIFSKEMLFTERPEHFVPYHYEIDPQQLSQGDIPLLFLDPAHDLDMHQYLEPYQGKAAILVCETFQHLYQLMECDPFAEILHNPLYLLYVMNMHPEMQFLAQNLLPFQGKSLNAVLPRKIAHLDLTFPRFAVALQKAIDATCNQEKNSATMHESVTYLFHLALKWVSFQNAQRYGKSRCLALHNKQRVQGWFEKHKDLPKQNIDLGFTPQDFVMETLVEAEATRRPRVIKKDKKIRLVHVVPQLIDGTHSPSKLLRCLLYNADRETFDISVIISDLVTIYPLDYPSQTHYSYPSKLRAPQSFFLMKENGIDVWVAEPLVDIPTVAHSIAQKLDEWNATIAVFHGPDEVNMLASSLTNTPLRVLFEHGTPPEYPGFDVALLSSEEAMQIHQKKLQMFNTESHAINFSLDIRKTWEEKPYTKESLGLPPDAFVMTTISNHLIKRLNKQVCMAIGEILRRCPHAYYLPLGPINEEQELRNYFEPFGVNDRVKFLGHKDNPGQYARSMDLYLNEFPFGSGIGILEGMAAGCPVVSMYDPQGPQQSRYGGIYFGVDRMAHNIDEYIELACRLATDKNMYDEWSKHANEQYEKRADEKTYVQTFETILKNSIENKQKTR